MFWLASLSLNGVFAASPKLQFHEIFILKINIIFFFKNCAFSRKINANAYQNKIAGMESFQLITRTMHDNVYD